MGTLVVIRHAIKKYGNKDGGKPRYDSPIIDAEWERSRSTFKEYIEKHNIKPTKIISSPYLRTRQTSAILSEMTGVDFEINRFISEYLGWNKDFSEEDFEPHTYSHNPFPPESVDSYRMRIRRAFEYIIRDMKDGEVIWVITHGFAVKTFLYSRDIKMNNVRPLEGAIIGQDDIKILK